MAEPLITILSLMKWRNTLAALRYIDMLGAAYPAVLRSFVKVANGHLSKGSNHKDRLAARIKRNHPEIAAHWFWLNFLLLTRGSMPVSPRVRGV